MMIAARFFRYIPTHIPRWAKYLVSITLLTLLIAHIDWSSVVENIRNATPGWFVLYAVFIILGNVISAYRWKLLASLQGFSGHVWSYIRWYITATFINNFLPGFLGGDAYRAYMLGRTHYGKHAPSIFTILVDRAVGLFAGLLVAVVSGAVWFLVFGVPTSVVAQMLFMFSVVALCVAVIIVSFRLHFIQRLARIFPSRYVAYVAFAQKYTTHSLVVSIALGVVFMLIGVALANYILFVALGIAPEVIPFLFFVMIASVISSVPISIGNIGVKEWAYITLFGIIGISSSTAVTVVLIGRVLQAVISCIGVPFYLAQNKETRTLLRRK